MSIQITDRDFELLSQWVDGELNDIEARRLTQRLKSEPDLQRMLQRLQTLNHTLYHSLTARAPVPETVVLSVLAATEDSPVREIVREKTLAHNSNVVRLPVRAADQAPRRRGPRWPLAIAASLVAAVGAIFVAQQPTVLQTELPGNDAVVSTSLTTLPSGDGWTELGDGRELQPVLTFAHRDGTWCREFLLKTASSDWRAVACREGSRWVTQAAGLESYLDSASGYRPAGASDSAPVSVFITENAADIALGRDEEASLIRQGW